MGHPERHGGNLEAVARQLGCPPRALLDASASLVPFGPPLALRLELLQQALWPGPLRAYPDRDHTALRQAIGALHDLDPGWVLPGNGAAELFTWAGREAAAIGVSVLPQPGFADYSRALACWGGASRALPLPLHWSGAFPQPFPPVGEPAQTPAGAVLWLTNPHNPTGQLWSRASLEPLLQRFALVICDEAFLPLVAGGEAQSLTPLLDRHPNLVVVRSLTKLYGIAGLRLGYVLTQPERLRRWAGWRDPWPLNGLACRLGVRLLADRAGHQRWCQRVQRWSAGEGAWLGRRIAALPGLEPLPSAANFLLLRGDRSLVPLAQALQRRRILVRDCRSFAGLDSHWLRLGLQDRRGNRRLLAGLRAAAPG